MKALLIGLGQIGLGLVNPVFKSAGYDIVGTDADTGRLDDLGRAYLLKTPSKISAYEIKTAKMEDLTNEFDLVITSVGRRHLDKVAEWYQRKKFLAPVLLAENLPDPAIFFQSRFLLLLNVYRKYFARDHRALRPKTRLRFC